MNPASVAQTIRDGGIEVDDDRIGAEWDELEGLPPEQRSQTLLAAYGLDPYGKQMSKLRLGKGSLSASWEMLRGEPRALVFVFIAALAGIVPGLAVPLLIRVFVNRFIVSDDGDWIAPVLIGLVAALLVAGAVRSLQFAVLNRRFMTLTAAGQVTFTWKALRLPVPELSSRGSGDLVARFEALQRLAYQGGVVLPLAAISALNTLVFAIAIVFMNPILGAVGILVSFLTIAVIGIVLYRRGNVQETADGDRVALSRETAEIISGIESVKAPAWEQFLFRGWAKIRGQTGRSVSELGLADQRLGMVPELMQALGLGVVLAVGAWLVIDGRMALGTLVASQAFLASMLLAVNQLAMFGVLAQSIRSGAGQVQDVLSLPIDPECLTSNPQAPSPRKSSALSLNGVTFGYRRDKPPLIDDLDLRVPAGSRIAIVGGSGSGKSTIARLAVGELRPWSGTVDLDDRARLAITRQERVDSVAYVPQECKLVPGTILENLTLLDETAQEVDVSRAMEDARIAEVIRSRPGGIHATVDGGTGGFSGGELQRLAIARALVSNPSILILDEATSALDPVVENELELKLRARGCTSLVVAHRLSTVRDSDEIVVVDRGRIVQRGQFDEIAHEGKFAELVNV